MNLEIVAGLPEALDSLATAGPAVIVAEAPTPDWTPEEILEEVQRVSPLTPVVVHHSGGGVRDAVRLTKLGAFHFLDDSAAIEEFAYAVEAAAEQRSSAELALSDGSVNGESWKRFLVGESRPMRQIGQLVRLVGPRRCTVLICGETGTGKEMAARAVHAASPRAHLPLVAVNCTTLPENLLEAELFGHVKGAFTGAFSHRVGRFEQAHRSTLFLDEIGDMPIDIQAKLLRVLQEREFQRLGSSETVKVDVRIIAASNVDLVERIRQGRFREDLFYRLNVVPLEMPPLRERSSDIPLLVHHFIAKVCRQEEIPEKKISRETLDRLLSYAWPGNVRQLENAVEMAIALSGSRQMLVPGDFPLPRAPLPGNGSRSGAVPSISLPDGGLDFEDTVGRIERQILEQALRKANGNKSQAADLLRLKRTTLSAKLKSLSALAASC